MSKAAELWVACWQALEVLGKRGATTVLWLWRGKKAHHNSKKYFLEAPWGLCLHTCMLKCKVQVLYWACVIPAECKSRAKEWGRVKLLSAFSFRGLQGVWCLGCWKCLRFLCYPLVVCDKSCWIAMIAQLWQTTVCVFEWLCCTTSSC